MADKPTCLLSFSGGLDSLAAIGVLTKWGYDITLGHISWTIEDTDFGEVQSRAAYHLARELDLKLEVLAHMFFPRSSYAKYSWVPVCISTILHHAGDPCVYPADNVQRYDAVAFGTDFVANKDVDRIRRYWLAGMQEYAYHGEVLYPLDGMSRAERRAIVPDDLAAMTVSCYLGPSAAEPCGKCWKCLE